MRMARRLGIVSSAKLKLLVANTWAFRYAGGERVWNTNIPSDPNQIYSAGPPSIDSNGSHSFVNTTNLNQVTVACTPIAIDISKFSTIRIKYSEWLNNSWTYRSTIELLPEGYNSYLTNYGNDICIMHEDDSKHGEIVYTIPDEAKQRNPMRRLWIKAVKNYYATGGVSIKVDEITLER